MKQFFTDNPDVLPMLIFVLAVTGTLFVLLCTACHRRHKAMLRAASSLVTNE